MNGRAIRTQMAPLRQSSNSVSAATLGPATRRALVVPMLPEPALRMSVWLNTRPKIRPNGIAPIKNETTAQMAVSRIGLCILLFLLPKEESNGRAGKIES